MFEVVIETVNLNIHKLFYIIEIIRSINCALSSQKPDRIHNSHMSCAAPERRWGRWGGGGGVVGPPLENH